MFKAGRFVSQHIDPTAPAQIQPNGVDLTLDEVFTQTSPGAIRTDSKDIGDRNKLIPASNSREYTLEPGGYIVRYNETITIPQNHIGFIYPRSSLLRNSGMLNTAVWDAGYTGRGEGLLQLHHALTIEENARIAQIVLADATHTDTYNGSYQEENL